MASTTTRTKIWTEFNYKNWNTDLFIVSAHLSIYNYTKQITQTAALCRLVLVVSALCLRLHSLWLYICHFSVALGFAKYFQVFSKKILINLKYIYTKTAV